MVDLPSLLETYLPLQFKVLLCFSVFSGLLHAQKMIHRHFFFFVQKMKFWGVTTCLIYAT